jgi:hypothetical protein
VKSRWEFQRPWAKNGPILHNLRDCRELGWSRPISRVLSRTIIHLEPPSPAASSNLPGSPRGQRFRAPKGPRILPYLSCSRWGLPCRGVLPPARCALTAPFHPYSEPSPIRSGIFSVALSVDSRPPGVTWHPAAGARTFLPINDLGHCVGRLPGRLRGQR